MALLQAAAEGESWRSVAPSLFGVSEAEFEAGWWAWLATEYGVDTSGFVGTKAYGVAGLLGRQWLVSIGPWQ